MSAIGADYLHLADPPVLLRLAARPAYLPEAIIGSLRPAARVPGLKRLASESEAAGGRHFSLRELEAIRHGAARYGAVRGPRRMVESAQAHQDRMPVPIKFLVAPVVADRA